MKVADRFEPGAVIGPLIDMKAVEKVEAYVADAVKKAPGSSAATSAVQVLLPPNCRLCPSELVELGGAQRRLCDREEFVELRRRYGGAAEHRMRLAAMVDLVLKQVQQEAIGPLRLHARAEVHLNDPVWPGFVERIAPGDQASIDRRLGGPQLRDRGTGNWIGPRGRAERAALERIDVEPVDDQDVVQGGLDRWEKAGSRRFERRLCQSGKAASKRWFAQALLYAIARKV